MTVSNRDLSGTSVGVDLVRGLAALLVAAGHMRGLSLLDYGSLPSDQRTVITMAFFAVTRLGHEGVIIFFVLSGYLVGGGSVGTAMVGKFSPVNYLIDRVTRVFVPLSAAVILTVCVILLHREPTPSVAQISANMLAVNGPILPTLKYNSALWTLTYETFFYWFFLVVMMITLRRNDPKMLMVWVLAALGVTGLFAALEFRYLLIWGFGILVYLARDTLAKASYFIGGTFIFIGGVIFYQLQMTSNAFGPGISSGAPYAEILLGFGVAIALPAISTFRVGEGLKWLITIASFLAGISYSLYLTHLPIIGLFDLIDPTRMDLSGFNLAVLSLKMATAIIFAWLFSLVFEKGSFRLRKMIKAQLIA